MWLVAVGMRRRTSPRIFRAPRFKFSCRNQKNHVPQRRRMGMIFSGQVLDRSNVIIRPVLGSELRFVVLSLAVMKHYRCQRLREFG